MRSRIETKEEYLAYMQQACKLTPEEAEASWAAWGEEDPAQDA